jgi:hypothetical protein
VIGETHRTPANLAFPLREGHRMRAFEDKIIERQCKLHDEELNAFCSSLELIRVI